MRGEKRNLPPLRSLITPRVRSGACLRCSCRKYARLPTAAAHSIRCYCTLCALNALRDLRNFILWHYAYQRLHCVRPDTMALLPRQVGAAGDERHGRGEAARRAGLAGAGPRRRAAGARLPPRRCVHQDSRSNKTMASWGFNSAHLHASRVSQNPFPL